MSKDTSDRLPTEGVLLGLDVGSRRIGVAMVRPDVRIPRPLTTIAGGPSALDNIQSLVHQYEAVGLVVGWPRGLQGQSTAQTLLVEQFVAGLRARMSVPVHLQDEALTSQKAEAELQSRGKPFGREEIDALAATYILEDYVAQGSGVTL